jgi:hypothetical protein
MDLLMRRLQLLFAFLLVCTPAAFSGSVPAIFAEEIAPAQSAQQEKLPDGIKVLEVQVNSTQIELQNKFAYRQLLITGLLEDGQSCDLTRIAKLVSQPQHVSVSPLGQVRPISDGDDQLIFEFEGKQVTVNAKVTGTSLEYQPSFMRDVQPTFSKVGCNAGTCHGSKDGKNGFKLSLRGYDALYDYRAFTDDIAARRFNRVAPDQSLMLLKASGAIPHVGGQLTKPGEPYYELLRQWIAQGVHFDLETSARVSKIDVLPQNPILPRAGMRQQITVIATYTDGSVRDVTAESFIESGNIEVLDAGSGGLVKMIRRGESPVLVRYEGNYAATTLTAMGDRTGFVWSNPPEFNYVDALVDDKLQRMKIEPSELCSDDVFIRRIYLDLTGLPPTAEQTKAFLNDERETQIKRDELIDLLIGNHEYVEHWTNKWADLLQVNRKFLGEEGSIALRNWIKQSVATNKPYDQFAREILTASGSTLENPPAAYFKVLREPVDLMENTTHLFLAVRFNCNKCHDHPFERWTQDQYYHMAAYFSQVGRKEDPAFRGKTLGGSAVEGAKPLVEVIYDQNSGEVIHDRTGQTAAPDFPYTHSDVISEGSRREQLAQWITSPENQYFARSYVNRLWGYMFGVGIIEPIDDIRAGNPPTNPELLSALEQEFIESGFNVQQMLKTICKSRTYQTSVVANEWNADDQINYSHALPRRLPAETLFDAIHFATGSRPNIPGVPAGFRAAELPDAGVSVPFLDDFGKPVRESSCECERSTSMVLGPIMKLVNGPTVADALADPANDLHKLVNEIKDDRVLIQEVFLRFLSRYPTEDEIQLGLDAINQAGQGHEANVAALQAYEATIAEKVRIWEADLNRPVEWKNADLVELKSDVGAEFKVQDDKSVFVSGNLDFDTYQMTAQTDLKKITGIRLEALNDASLPAGGPGRAQNGNFVLNEFILEIARKDQPEKQRIKLKNGKADFSQESWDVAGAVDGNEGSGWAVSPQFNQTHIAFFETEEDVQLQADDKISISMVFKFQDKSHLLGKFRISLTESQRPFGGAALPEALAKLIAIPVDQRTPEQVKQISAEFEKTDRELQSLRQAVAQTQIEVNNKRLAGTQDLAWALINNPSFLFNR